MLTVNEYAASGVNERRIADYEVKFNGTNLLSDIKDLLENQSSGEHDIPYFDGGKYGAIAYLDADNKIAYYTATSTNDIIVSDATQNYWVIKKIDGYPVTNLNVLGYSIGSTTESLPDNFMRKCFALRSLYGLSNITTIGSGVLSLCYTFNQPLTIPNVTSIGDYFLSGCYLFNQPLTISNATSIGIHFLENCFSFDQLFTIPATVTSIGGYFLYDCCNLTQAITVNTPSSPVDAYSLSTYTLGSPARLNGITLAGTYAQAWKDALPNRSSAPYRKLIVA